MEIVRLLPGDANRLRSIRLRALEDSPDAFGATLGEAAARPLEYWDSGLAELATFVAVENDRDVGLARGALDGPLMEAGYLLSMWVEPEMRRQGIGTALIHAVVQWGKAQKLKVLLLDVAEKNSSAIALYLRAGFTPNGQSGSLPPPREHIREIQMTIRLDGWANNASTKNT